MKKHAPPPTRFGPVVSQPKVAGIAPPPRPSHPTRLPPGPPRAVQKMSTDPFTSATQSVVATWEDYNKSKTKERHDLQTRTLAGIVTQSGTVVVGTSAWDQREEHEKSSTVFAPVLEVGRHPTFGVSCGEKDAILTLLEQAFGGKEGNLAQEHERCAANYFKIVREKLKDKHGKMQGVVALQGAARRTDLTYLECCDGCYQMLVRRAKRVYSVPDLVRAEKKHNTTL